MVYSPLSKPEAAAARRRIARLEHLLEGLVHIPLVGRRIGLDAIIGLVPGIGDVAAGALGLYLVWETRNLGASRVTLVRMLANVGIDTAIGSLPVGGNLFDIFFGSNRKNLNLIRSLMAG